MDTEMDDYYAPHPRFAIDRPLVLVGHPGAGVAAIGHRLAGRTGLPLNDIARAVESRAGRSRSQILVEEGRAALRDLEAAALEQAVRREPFGVVALDGDVLEIAPVRAATRAAAHVLWVDRPPEVLLARLRSALAEAPGSVPDFVAATPTSVEDLALFLASREEARRESHGILDAGSLHAAAVADELLASLGQLIGMSRL